MQTRIFTIRERTPQEVHLTPVEMRSVRSGDTRFSGNNEVVPRQLVANLCKYYVHGREGPWVHEAAQIGPPSNLANKVPFVLTVSSHKLLGGGPFSLVDDLVCLVRLVGFEQFCLKSKA